MEDKQMNNEVETMEVIDAAPTTKKQRSGASKTNTTKAWNVIVHTVNKPKKGRMAWAMAHPEFVEILDPELKAQMVAFRDEDAK